MSDTIEILGLRLFATHGVLESEKSQPQPFEFDLYIVTDFAAAAAADELASTIDYGALVDRVSELVASERFDLVETLGSAIVAAVLGHDDRIDEVTVAVRKMRPPLPVDVRSVGVRLTRARAAAPAGSPAGLASH